MCYLDSTPDTAKSRNANATTVKWKAKKSLFLGFILAVRGTKRECEHFFVGCPSEIGSGDVRN